MTDFATNQAELACTLNEASFKKRRLEMRKDLLPHVVNSHLEKMVLTLEFTNNDAMRDLVNHFVDLERQCCGFLNFTISPPGKLLVLKILGPEGSKPILLKVYEEANMPRPSK